MPNQVTVKKDELQSVLSENRAKHRAIFEAALEGYKKQALSMIEERLARLSAGKVEALSITLPIPEDHTPDYDRALRMLAMEVDNIVELDEREFARLVMDDWEWKRQFVTTAAAYTVI